MNGGRESGRPSVVAPTCATITSLDAAVADCRACADDYWSVLIRCGDCGQWRDLLVPGPAMRELEAMVMAGWHEIERTVQDLAEGGDR